MKIKLYLMKKDKKIAKKKMKKEKEKIKLMKS